MAVNEFKSALRAFIQGEGGMPDVDAALVELLGSDPSAAAPVLELLNKLYLGSRLRAQDYIALKERIEAIQAGAAESGGPQAGEGDVSDVGTGPPKPDEKPAELVPPPPEEAPGPEVTSSPILDILGGGAEPAPPPDTTITEPPGEEGPPPSAEKTVFRGARTEKGEESRPSEDKTVFRGGTAARPSAGPPAEETGEPAAEERAEATDGEIEEPAPSEDKTVFKAKPKAPDTGAATGPTGTGGRPAATDGTEGTGPITTGGEPTGPQQWTGPADTGPITGGGTGPYPGTGPHTGTGPYTGTGPPTGTGPHTGTGSNWTDPSKWGETAALTLDAGSVLKERYVLEVLIGRGGMGKVFKAKDLRREEAQDRNPHVAVKILNDDFRQHPESLKALQRESRKAQDLAHPNIVTVFDFDRDGATVFMTMEFLKGQSLDRITKAATFTGMPMAEAFELVRGLGNALSYAHGKGVVHSDFKPANVFLTRKGVVKVFDFGIARAAKLPGDRAGEETKFDPGTLGALTPAYASCEMLDGEEPDPRDDIYALACVVYELLTGKHPFEKLPASEARDKGMSPAQVKGLSRRQWRAMRKGLAFRRDDRMPDVRTFVDELRPRKISRTSMALAAAAAVAIVAVGTVFIPGYLEQRQVDRWISIITGGEEQAIREALETLGTLKPDVRRAIIEDDEVEDEIIEYFVARIEDATATGEYLLGERLFAEATALYDDSSRLDDASERNSTAKEAARLDLFTRFDNNLEAGHLLQQDGDDIPDVLEEYRRIDPEFEELQSRLDSLADAMADATDSALASDPPDLARAEPLIREGRALFPDDPRLRIAETQYVTLRDVRKNAQRVAELEASFERELPALQTSTDFLRFEQDLVELRTRAPDSPQAARFQARLEELLERDIAGALEARRWADARDTITSLDSLAGAQFLASQRARIEAAEQKYNQRVAEVQVGIDAAVQTGKMDEAESRLAELERLSEDLAIRQQARERVARGYLDLVLKAQNDERFDDARALVPRGRRVGPIPEGWDQVERDLEAFATAVARGQAERERQILEQRRRELIATLNGQIEQELARREFGLDTARRTVELIEKLRTQDPTEPVAVSGPSDVAARLASRAEELGEQGEWDAALALVDGAIALLPGQAVLPTVKSSLQEGRDAELARLAAQREQDLKARLDSLAGQAEYSREDDSKLRGLVQNIEALPGTEAYIGAKREQVAVSYLIQAEALIESNRYREAEQKIDASEWFVKGLEAAADVRRRLDESRVAYNRENEARQRDNQIAMLTNTFETALGAEDIKAADRALAILRRLPGTESFVREEAPRAFADTYLRMARNALKRDDFDQAERLAKRGLERLPGMAALETLLGAIRDQRLAANMADLKAEIATAPPVDPGRGQRLFGQILADAGDRAPNYESELNSAAQDRVAVTPPAEQPDVAAWLASFLPTFLAKIEPPPTPPPAPPPPRSAGRPCAPALANMGASRGGRCYDVLSDGTTRGPRMVVVDPGGGLPAFAISRFEISVGDWDNYCRLSGVCSVDQSMNRRLPITNVSADDMAAYARWLGNGDASLYRLPTDAEWLAAADAGGTPAPPANCKNPTAGTGDRLLEVNRGRNNGWGLMNCVGNAQELVVHPNGGYKARGGYYRDDLGECSVDKSRSHSGQPDRVTGFRLVRKIG